MRPVAVGCTLRRLAAKVASNKALEDMATMLAPHQLGYGVKGGAEAVVHSARLFLRNLKPDQALLKLDFKNAFNSIHRDKMLSSVLDLAPDIFQFVYSAYSITSVLFWGDKSLQSSEGLQLHSQMKSEFHVLYLDDVTLGGNLDDVVHDLVLFDREAVELGLSLNQQKSEVICEDDHTRAAIQAMFPEARVVSPSEACLLGSPIGYIGTISSIN